MATRIIIDISVGLTDSIPVWPGSTGFDLQFTSKLITGVSSNNSKIECDVHVGTHIDAPSHFIEGGLTVENLSLDKMIGDVYVVDLQNINMIDEKILSAQKYPENLKKLLIKTDNSYLWSRNETKFNKDYVALTEDGAQWIVDNNIDLVGIDYLSIQRFNDPSTTHEILLKHEVVILEGICLSNVEQGCYELLCLPIKIVGADGAPARAVLIKN
jgi:arylformamidase